MKPGIFKSATALVMIASLVAPLPSMAQSNAEAGDGAFQRRGRLRRADRAK